VPPGQQPETTPHLYNDLKDHLRAKDRDRAIESYYQLLSSGRPLSEIIAAGIEQVQGPEKPLVAVDSAVVPPRAVGGALLSATETSATSTEAPHGADDKPPLQSIPELLLGHPAFSGSNDIHPAGYLGSVVAPHEERAEAHSDTLQHTKEQNIAVPNFYFDVVSRKVRLVTICMVCGGTLGLAGVGGISFLHRDSEPAVKVSQAVAGRVEANPSTPDHVPLHATTNTAAAPLVPTVTTTEMGSNPAKQGKLADSEAAENRALSRQGEIPPVRPISPVASTIHNPIDQQNPPADGSAIDIKTSPQNSEARLLGKGEIEAFLSRGDALFIAGDITSARLFYHYGADAGDSSAALRLGETFDPRFLQRAKLSYIRGDAQTAAFWYNRASELGSADATLLLNRNSSLDK
jgi:hypothetical protein